MEAFIFCFAGEYLSAKVRHQNDYINHDNIISLYTHNCLYIRTHTHTHTHTHTESHFKYLKYILKNAYVKNVSNENKTISRERI